MGSLEEQLAVAGNRLLPLPSSVDELLLLLDRVENRLVRVEQVPSKSMLMALAPCKKALVADELLRHPDADVKVAVASCISEMIRITAPDAPYEDDQMKDVFQLIVSSFENLSDKSSRSYHRRTLILETVAIVRSCVVMLDLECDGLIVEMFQHFLKAIRDNHPEIVFSSMETIMTIVLEESEDISFELISPILASVKKDDQAVLPIARKLGKRVFEKCSTKLKPYLVQAKKCLGFSLDDYSKIVSSVCDGTTDAVGPRDDRACGEQMVQVNKESVRETRPEDLCAGSSPKTVMGDGLAEPGNEDRLADSELSKKPVHAQRAGHSIDKNVTTDAQPDYSDSGRMVKSKSKVKITSKKRRRKLNSSVKSEPSDQVDSDKEAERTHNRLSSPKALAGEPVNVAFPPPSGGISGGGRPKKAGRREKKENFIQEGSPSIEVSKKSSEVAIDPELMPQKQSRKRVRAAGTLGEKTPALAKTFMSEDGMASDSEAKPLKELGRKVVIDGTRYGSSSKKEDGKRRGRHKAASEKDVTKAATKDGAKEVVSSPNTASKLAKGERLPNAVFKRKHTTGKGRLPDAMEYGANLVGAKVKVWWPDDEKFYEGVIASFDSNEKKHRVSYTDGDVEVLNLRQEKWEFRSDFMADGEQATGCHSLDPSPEMNRKKKAKTNSKSEAKQGEMEGSRGGETSLRKLKGSASKSGRILNDATSKSDGNSDDDNVGKKSKDPLKKSKASVASSTLGRSKNVDGCTPKTKSKQETAKTATVNNPKTSPRSKGKVSKGGGTSNVDGNGKAKPAFGKWKASKGNEESPKPEEDTKKSGKKRQRGAES